MRFLQKGNSITFSESKPWLDKNRSYKVIDVGQTSKFYKSKMAVTDYIEINLIRQRSCRPYRGDAHPEVLVQLRNANCGCRGF